MKSSKAVAGVITALAAAGGLNLHTVGAHLRVDDPGKFFLRNLLVAPLSTGERRDGSAPLLRACVFTRHVQILPSLRLQQSGPPGMSRWCPLLIDSTTIILPP